MRRLALDRSAGKRTYVAEYVRAEIERDLAAYNAYVEKHGSPAEMLRDHLTESGDTT